MYDKSGNLLLGPVDTGTLWAGFPIEDCTDPSGDPVVLYDQTHRPLDPDPVHDPRAGRPVAPFYNCVAVSVTGDPTGAYYRYAFRTQPDLVDGGYFFPDYPKYGVWTNSYVMTTRDFGLRRPVWHQRLRAREEQDGERRPECPRRAVLPRGAADVVPLELVGDGLLPPDIDGNRRPKTERLAMPDRRDAGRRAGYGATFDALNIWELDGAVERDADRRRSC